MSAPEPDPAVPAGRDATPVPLSREDVVHVARLARLDLSDEEVEDFRFRVPRIVGEAP